jgi:hypothetical protein
VAKTLLFKLLGEAGQAIAGTMIGDERRGEGRQHLRFIATTENGAEDRIKETHGI